MDIKTLQARLLEYWKFLQKRSLGNQLMRKKTLSTAEKVIGSLVFGLIVTIITIAYVIIPNVQRIQVLQKQILEVRKSIYGDLNKTDSARQYILQKKELELSRLEKIFTEQRKTELEKLNQALPKDDNIYNLVVYLEDYTVTLNTPEKPIVLLNVNTGAMTNQKIDVKDLQKNKEIDQNRAEMEKNKQAKSVESEETLDTTKISIPAEYRIMPVNLTIEAHPEKFEQFLDFIYHSGDTDKFFYKGRPVPKMTVESVNLEVKTKDEMLNAAVGDENKRQSYSIQINAYFQMAEKTKDLPADKTPAAETPQD
ncbi:MAG TPA: hypothetical protein PLQ36_02050 [Candidatus Gracilibacteria bacterium]|nr:hypothetical protein [Candidatus Gracilibacteria bacterium]